MWGRIYWLEGLPNRWAQWAILAYAWLQLKEFGGKYFPFLHFWTTTHQQDNCSWYERVWYMSRGRMLIWRLTCWQVHRARYGRSRSQLSPCSGSSSSKWWSPAPQTGIERLIKNVSYAVSIQSNEMFCQRYLWQAKLWHLFNDRTISLGQPQSALW